MEPTLQHPKIPIEDTRKHIITAARQFFSEYTYLGVSMSDIAKKLKVTKAALYYHFTGKSEIYRYVLDEVYHDLCHALGVMQNSATIDTRLHAIVQTYLNFGLKEKNLIKALVLKLSPIDHKITEHIAALRMQIVNLIQPVITEALVSKRLNNKLDSRTLTTMLTSMMDGLILEYSFFKKNINLKKISDQIVAVLF